MQVNWTTVLYLAEPILTLVVPVLINEVIIPTSRYITNQNPESSADLPLFFIPQRQANSLSFPFYLRRCHQKSFTSSPSLPLSIQSMNQKTVLLKMIRTPYMWWFSSLPSFLYIATNRITSSYKSDHVIHPLKLSNNPWLLLWKILKASVCPTKPYMAVLSGYILSHTFLSHWTLAVFLVFCFFHHEMHLPTLHTLGPLLGLTLMCLCNTSSHTSSLPYPSELISEQM